MPDSGKIKMFLAIYPSFYDYSHSTFWGQDQSVCKYVDITKQPTLICPLIITVSFSVTKKDLDSFIANHCSDYKDSYSVSMTHTLVKQEQIYILK